MTANCMWRLLVHIISMALFYESWVIAEDSCEQSVNVAGFVLLSVLLLRTNEASKKPLSRKSLFTEIPEPPKEESRINESSLPGPSPALFAPGFVSRGFAFTRAAAHESLLAGHYFFLFVL